MAATLPARRSGGKGRRLQGLIAPDLDRAGRGC
jgi:hypothetical protein